MNLKYLIVGSGYRARFYARIARTYPDLFSAVYLCRSEEKARLMLRERGLSIQRGAGGRVFQDPHGRSTRRAVGRDPRGEDALDGVSDQLKGSVL